MRPIEPQAVLDAYQRTEAERDPELRLLSVQMLATTAPTLAKRVLDEQERIESLEAMNDMLRLHIRVLTSVSRPFQGVVVLPSKERDQ